MNLPEAVSYYKQDNDSVIRTQFTTEEEIEEWATNLMQNTKVTWSTTRTIRTLPLKARKHVFKRTYHCHFKTTIHKPTVPRKRQHSSRNIECPAEMIIILVYVPQQKSRAKVPDELAKKWPCIITFKNDHNHSVHSAAALTKRPISDNVKQEVIEYFQRGHSAASAYHSFCFKKMEELGDQYDSLSSDRHFFPNKIDFSNLWNVHFKNHYGERTGSQMFLKLEENLRNSRDVLFKIANIGEHYAVSLCTPIMKRASELLVQSSEILFVDATSNCDVQNHKLYFFATQSASGGVPVGCVITTSQKEEVFDDAVKNLTEIIPNEVNPKVIVTDDDLVERRVLQKYWQSSKLILCTFHVLKAVWKWLNVSKNNIKKEDRQHHYQLFRKILMSKTKDDLEVNTNLFYANCKYHQFEKNVKEKIECNISSWCLYFRQNYLTRGCDTNNSVEVMFRLFKDIPLERTKAYNLPQLTDFIITEFESYYKQRILDLVYGKVKKSTLDRFCPNEKGVSADKIVEIGDKQFNVVSCQNSDINYFVDMNIGVCTCPIGTNGKICKHQSSIIKNFKIEDVCNTLTSKNKIILYKIATGSEPPQGLLSSLKLEHLKIQKQPRETPTQLIMENHGMHQNTDNNIVEPSTSENYNNTQDFCYGKNDFDVENEWNNFLKKIDEDVKTALQDDPCGFIPAIRSCVTSYKKNVNSSSTLMTGLFSMFKFNGVKSLKVASTKTYRKGKKIGIQPTSVARRKAVASGRRRIQAGRTVGCLTKKKVKAPHSLIKCVEKNIPLGGNKHIK